MILCKYTPPCLRYIFILCQRWLLLPWIVIWAPIVPTGGISVLIVALITLTARISCFDFFCIKVMLAITCFTGHSILSRPSCFSAQCPPYPRIVQGHLWQVLIILMIIFYLMFIVTSLHSCLALSLS